MNAKYLECWKLNKTFLTPAGPFVAVKDFDLNLAEGEFVSVIGHSGCGKSTVLSIIAGLHKKDGGAMILDNREVRGAGPDRAVVFQSPCLLPWLTAMDNVLLGLDQGRLRVVHVMRGGPAAAAGWKRGDLICRIDGQPIPGDYPDSPLANWSTGAPGRIVSLGMCDGTVRTLTLRQFY